LFIPCFLTAIAPGAGTRVEAAKEFIFEVRNLDDLALAQAAVEAPARDVSEALTVRFAPITFELADTFRIGRSGVTVVGQTGTRLVLGDHVNKPVISVGSQADFVTAADLIENIVIKDMTIDGNKDNQDSETGVDAPWIRNNGIDVRAVRRLTVERVHASNNRSGGLVISWGSSEIRVIDCVFEKNFFDGIAFYTSTRILVANCAMRNNGFAGISLDNDLLESAFTGCILDSNRDVGVFARNSSNLAFRNCVIENSGDWGVFLAHDDEDRGVHDIEFAVCEVSNNRGGLFMASVGEHQSSGTRVVGSTFHGNERDGRRNIETSGSAIWAAGNLELH
jgi:parallel beta-helix repeat protein